MASLRSPLVLALTSLSVLPSLAAPSLGAYFANWARYHTDPYTYTMDDLAPIVPRLNELNYAFLYFCPPPGTSPMPYWSIAPYGSCTDATAFQLMSVEPADQANLATLAGYKQQNPNMKILLSVGGWNFPSEYFSALAASPSARATWIASVQSWMTQFSADGVVRGLRSGMRHLPPGSWWNAHMEADGRGARLCTFSPPVPRSRCRTLIGRCGGRFKDGGRGRTNITIYLYHPLPAVPLFATSL